MNNTESEDDFEEYIHSVQWNPEEYDHEQDDDDDDYSPIAQDDGIVITEWKDKNIVREAETSGRNVIKDRYLTAVPAELISDKKETAQSEQKEPEMPKLNIFYEEDVFVPPEEPEPSEEDSKDAEAAPEMSDEDLDYNDVFQNDPEILRKRKKKRKVRGIIRNIVKEALILVLIFVFSVFIVASFNVLFRRQNEVYGSSMEPNYIQGDTVYSSYFEYITGKPEVGDIVIFDFSAFDKDKAPTFFDMLGDVLKNNKLTQFVTKKELPQDTYWIKRVVGVGGDTIEFRNGQFFRNGEYVYEEYIKEQNVSTYPADGTTIVVPKGYVFLMGDNRNVSRDSRAIGCVPVKFIIGKCK